MLRFAFSFLLLFEFIAFAQPTSKFELASINKAQFILEKNRTKEMILPNQEEVHEEIGNQLLDSKSQKKLIQILNKSNSYQKGQALLTHHNIIFNLFQDKALRFEIQISTLTRNIRIYDRNNSNEIHCKISQKFGKFLIKLLVKYGWYEEIVPTGDLEGII
ncbi:hypothetical protein N8987_04370 [Crocinitomix sp.]|nr:hypothetical protein [Crocinitomix sp.]